MCPMINLGDPAPLICLPDQDDTLWQLSEYTSVILFFYPKDDTPGCTKAAVAFSALLPEFKALGVTVVGISRDTPATHRAFREKHGIRCPLLSDESGHVCEAYGVWQEKQNYGKVYKGIVRTTVWIQAGYIRHKWSRVRVAGHADAVYNEVIKS